MALDLRMKNGFRAISFEYVGVLDSYFIHMYVIIKYRSSSIMDKIHRLFLELWPYLCELGNSGGIRVPWSFLQASAQYNSSFMNKISVPSPVFRGKTL